MPELLSGNAWLLDIVKRHPFAEAEMRYQTNMYILKRGVIPFSEEDVQCVLLLPSVVYTTTGAGMIMSPIRSLRAGSLIFGCDMENGRLKLIEP